MPRISQIYTDLYPKYQIRFLAQYTVEKVTRQKCNPQRDYPKYLFTVGDHLLKKQFDLGMNQIKVAEVIGTERSTLSHWITKGKLPHIKFFPNIIEFLGYDPLLVKDENLIDTTKRYRREYGISVLNLAEEIGISRVTLFSFEAGKNISKGSRKKIESFIQKVTPDCDKPEDFQYSEASMRVQ